MRLTPPASASPSESWSSGSFAASRRSCWCVEIGTSALPISCARCSAIPLIIRRFEVSISRCTARSCSVTSSIVSSAASVCVEPLVVNGAIATRNFWSGRWANS